VKINVVVKTGEKTRRESVETEDKNLVEDVLDLLKINKNEVVTMIGNSIVPYDDELNDGDELTVLRVASRG
jgi:sulfur carrier protein ThiS